MNKLFAVAVAALAVTASGASAQDYSLSPHYGSIRLSAGFQPDPHSIRMTAGGSVDTSRLGSPCRGNVAHAPDYELTYSAGSLPLYIYAQADSDTTLVVNGPDGLWYCDDDSNGGLNPQVTFSSPRSGTYHIWVGTFNGGMTSATLYISEVAEDDDWSSVSSGRPDPSLRAHYGEIVLERAFSPDPHRISVNAGGTIQASSVSSSCRGMISQAPDYQITYSAGTLPLAFRTQSSVDTTLVINGPDGQWYCNDDGWTGTNAEIRFNKPMSGVYDIWVGTYSSEMSSAELLITELP